MSRLGHRMPISGDSATDEQRLPLAGGFLIAAGISVMLWGLVIMLVLA